MKLGSGLGVLIMHSFVQSWFELCLHMLSRLNEKPLARKKKRLFLRPTVLVLLQNKASWHIIQ